MGSLLRPIGAQPAGVYWARRALVLVLAVAVLGGIWFLFRPSEPVITATPASPTPSVSTPVSTPTPSDTVTPTPSPTGPVVCDQTNTELSLAGYQKVKQGGQQPFKVSLTNTSSQNCVLEVKPATFELTVTSGTDRIWSTAHCAKWVPAKKQTLKPKKAYEFSIEWKLQRSVDGCKTTKDVLRPGTYVGTATFADGLKARQVFTINKK